jgi:FkbM family methyltransferase
MSLAGLKQAFAAGALSKAAYIDAMHRAHQCLFEYAGFLRSTDIGRIEITDGRVVMTTRTGMRVLCNPADKRIAPLEILNFGTYEADHAAMMSALVWEGKTILDVGANIGFYTISLARQFPAATIWAFEPVPATFAYLRENLELNAVTNARIFNIGLSDQEGEQIYYFSPCNSVSASAARVAEEADTTAVVCRVRRLDKFVREHRLQIDFLKCDVEGAEYLVLRGAAETVRRDQPVIVAEMLRKWAAKFHYEPNDIIRFLGALGYRCFTSAGRRLVPFAAMDESTTETNFFFLHADKHREQIRAFEAARAA